MYSEDEQEFYINYLLSNEEAFVRTRSIIKPEYFAKKYQRVVRFIMDYTEQNSTLPLAEHIKAKTQFDAIAMKGNSKHDNSIMLDIEQFCRHKAIENAIERKC